MIVAPSFLRKQEPIPRARCTPSFLRKQEPIRRDRRTVTPAKAGTHPACSLHTVIPAKAGTHPARWSHRHSCESRNPSGVIVAPSLLRKQESIRRARHTRHSCHTVIPTTSSFLRAQESIRRARHTRHSCHTRHSHHPVIPAHAGIHPAHLLNPCSISIIQTDKVVLSKREGILPRT